MKPLDDESNILIGEDLCAALVIETFPRVMRTFRATMRKCRPAELSETQFRTLSIVQHHTGGTISLVADHLALSLPSASKLVDGLVKRGFITRVMSTEDRRCAIVTLTELGQSTLELVYHEALSRTVTLLAGLSNEERSTVNAAMQTLQRVFPTVRLEMEEAG